MKKKRSKKIIKPQRFDYSKNHQDIENQLLEHLRKHRVLPTQKQIAEAVGLRLETVNRHLKDIKVSNFMPHYKSLSPKVMLGLFSKALTGNPLAAKLWLQIVEGFSEKTTNVITDPDGKGLFENYKDLTDDELEAEITKRNTSVSNSKT